MCNWTGQMIGVNICIPSASRSFISVFMRIVHQSMPVQELFFLSSLWGKNRSFSPKQPWVNNIVPGWYLFRRLCYVLLLHCSFPNECYAPSFVGFYYIVYPFWSRGSTLNHAEFLYILWLYYHPESIDRLVSPNSKLKPSFKLSNTWASTYIYGWKMKPSKFSTLVVHSIFHDHFQNWNSDFIGTYGPDNCWFHLSTATGSFSPATSSPSLPRRRTGGGLERGFSRWILGSNPRVEEKWRQLRKILGFLIQEIVKLFKLIVDQLLKIEWW